MRGREILGKFKKKIKKIKSVHVRHESSIYFLVLTTLLEVCKYLIAERESVDGRMICQGVVRYLFMQNF